MQIIILNEEFPLPSNLINWRMLVQSFVAKIQFQRDSSISRTRARVESLLELVCCKKHQTKFLNSL